MKYSNNVIHFPKAESSQYGGAISDDDFSKKAAERLSDYKKLFIQQAIETIAPQIFNSLEMLGFAPAEDEEEASMKDGAIIVEAIRSFMYKTYNIDHPLQPLAESFFDYDTDGDLQIADNIKIVITPVIPKEEDVIKSDNS